MAALGAANVEVVSTNECGVSTTVDAWPYYLLFFVSGFPALLYQIVWERALFTIYGVNIESVTMIVTIFMLGLGLGSLLGGKLSALPRIRLLRAFGAIELSIGAFGIVSLLIFHSIAAFTAGASTFATGLITFFLLLIPTLLMGSTLPLLVAHFVRRTRNVGESVASLYSVNTLGSGVACFAAARFIMGSLGQSGSVRLAALLNTVVGITALLLATRASNSALAPPPSGDAVALERHNALPFRFGIFLAAAIGFVALAYEIIWYRVYSFASGGAAPCFARLLAFYLAGIAYGSFAIRDVCRKSASDRDASWKAASTLILAGSLVSFLVGPAMSYVCTFTTCEVTFPLIFIGAALFGAVFPLLTNATVGANHHTGVGVSYLYLSNIVGSALGSFLVGFVLLDHLSTLATSGLLLVLGLALSIIALSGTRHSPWSAGRILATAAGLALAIGSTVLFPHFYGRLLFKQDFWRAPILSDVVENRSGIITVTADGTVFGGGIYDGKFNTDPVHDRNGIFRAFAIPAFHPNPKEVLVIGLASGSWAQVLANDPSVQHMTIVEINPGYLGLIAKHPNVASLLRNPKVHIDIDDGRRWLMAHPRSRFDCILMNTTYYWRANSSNLLSSDFLQIVRSHLVPGGVEYYNTTWSEEALATGVRAFSYALRVTDFLALSDRPLRIDPTAWRKVLKEYRVDGRLCFDLSRQYDRERLEEMVSTTDPTRAKPEEDIVTESGESMLRRFHGKRTITDDNMGREWE